MGLDMYLTGEITFLPDESITPLVGQRFRLGYWRKHPNLHGYIVKHFAMGVDECQEIPLSAEDIRQILKAIRNRQLPDTDGFFFGKSDGSERLSDIKIFCNALAWLWLETPNENEWRYITYQASW